MEHKGGRRLGDAELLALAQGAAAVGAAGWRQEQGPLDVFTLRGHEEVVHLYARPEVGLSVLAALTSAREDIPRLVAEVRRLRAEIEEARTRKHDEAAVPAAVPKPRGEAAPREVPEIDVPLSLSAPFRVGPREMRAAKDDPLVALAVQVAKALPDDAREIERARLIAMAFAAARGDTPGFWAARQQRSTKAKAKSADASRKK